MVPLDEEVPKMYPLATEAPAVNGFTSSNTRQIAVLDVSIRNSHR